MTEWVFGYGSLVSPSEAHATSDLGEPREVDLHGYERRWDVAMWNPDPVNDHKHYVDPATDERPAIHVAFLNVRPSEGRAVNGVVIPVDHGTIDRFDAREVNYRRIDVTEAIEPRADGPVWTYVGLDAGLERFRRGLGAGNVFVSAEYHAYCRAAFEARGADHLRRYEETTVPPACPLRSLVLKRASDAGGF